MGYMLKYLDYADLRTLFDLVFFTEFLDRHVTKHQPGKSLAPAPRTCTFSQCWLF